MIDVFSKSFLATFLSVLQIFAVILFAGILMRRRLISQEHLSGLSRATVLVFLPCLIFSNIVQTLKPSEMSFWWTLPLSAFLITGLGLLLGGLLFIRQLPAKKNMLALAAFQNAGYLVLPVGKVLFPESYDRFALYSFLFVMGFNLLLWSLGKFLATANGGGSASLSGSGSVSGSYIGWRSFLTPPFVANVLALGLVFSGAGRHFPAPLLKATGLLGEAAVPVATFVLGAMLGGMPLRFRGIWGDAWRVLAVKLLFLPALIFGVLLLTPLGRSDPLLARFFIIEAAAAPAVGIMLQVRSYGGEEEKMGALMLLAYLGCLATLPAWVAAWNLWGMKAN